MHRERLTDHLDRLVAIRGKLSSRIATTKSSGGGRREIPDDYKYNPKKAKHLKRILHNVSVALGTLTSSLNEFSRVKGPDLSPDGRLGGVGYIMALTDIKQTINGAVHSLSTVADCIADELNNPKWAVAHEKETKDLIKEKDKVVEKIDQVSDDINPDDIANEEKDDIEQDSDEPAEKPEEGEKPSEESPEEHRKEPEESPEEEPENKPEAGFELKLASAVTDSLVNYFKKPIKKD